MTRERFAVATALLSLGIGLAVPGACIGGPAAGSGASDRVATAASHVPLAFEPLSDPDAHARFVANGPGYAVAVTPEGATLSVASREQGAAPSVLQLRLEGAGATRVLADGAAAATANHLVGPRASWRIGVPLYPRVRVERPWPGIDAVFYGNGRQLEYDFVVQPGASPEAIRLRFSGVRQQRLAEDGALLLEMPYGTVRQHPPVTYQRDAAGNRTPVDSRYAVAADGSVGFVVEPYDVARPLVIDPVLVYATYLGGEFGEFWHESAVAGAAVDAQGTLVVAGDTNSGTVSAQAGVDLRVAPADRDLFIARFNPAGSALLSVTYLGGDGLDDRASLAIAPDGSILVTGRTQSSNLPVSVGAFQANRFGTQDAFVARLDATASSLLYLTYLGGTGDDYANAVAVNAAGQAVVAGGTRSSNFPVRGAVTQGTSGGGTDAFVAVVNTNGTDLVFGTYLGGSNVDEANGVAVTTDGTIVVVGQTWSTNFPTLLAFQAALGGGSDAFVTGISPAGARVFSSYMGGTSVATTEKATRVATGPSNSFVVVGMTDSTNFPTVSPLQAANGGDLDAFAAKLSFTGGVLTRAYATYLGGDDGDAAFGVAVDGTGRAAITGGTQSSTFPPNVQAIDSTLGGAQDAFIVVLNSAGSAYDAASYFGGSGSDSGLAVAIEASGDVSVVGQTTSFDLPSESAGGGAPYDATANGQSDAFVIRLTNDRDGDGLPDAWETTYGLNPDDATGPNGAAGDGDRDFLTNLDEYRGGTSPVLSERFFAEGATGTGVQFSTRFAILNPQPDVTFDVEMQFLTGDGQQFTHTLPGVAPGQRVTVDVASIRPELTDAQFSTVIRSPYGVVADRTMTWSAEKYGSHAETSVSHPSTRWYFAEGATHSNFDLFYLLQNPADTTAQVRVTYLRPPPEAPLVKLYEVAPRSRSNIWVNQERFPDDAGAPLLASAEISAVLEVTNGVPIIAERAMYRTTPGQPLFAAGHESAGVTETSTRWFLAEGATNRDFFDLFVLVANPSPQDAQVRVTYLLPDGSSVVRRYGGLNADYPAVAANSRLTLWVNAEDPRLLDTAVSTIVESTNGVGVIVERAMWWPGPTAATWGEAHNSPGTTTTGTMWALADGEQGGAESWDTYILIANTSAYAGRARVTLHYEDGTTDSTEVDLNASSRYTVGVGFLGFVKANNARFGAIVEALPAAPGGQVPQVVVERAMYSADLPRRTQADYPPGRPYWPAGTNALATKLR